MNCSFTKRKSNFSLTLRDNVTVVKGFHQIATTVLHSLEDLEKKTELRSSFLKILNESIFYPNIDSFQTHIVIL